MSSKGRGGAGLGWVALGGGVDWRRRKRGGGRGTLCDRQEREESKAFTCCSCDEVRLSTACDASSSPMATPPRCPYTLSFLRLLRRRSPPCKKKYPTIRSFASSANPKPLPFASLPLYLTHVTHSKSLCGPFSLCCQLCTWMDEYGMTWLWSLRKTQNTFDLF